MRASVGPSAALSMDDHASTRHLADRPPRRPLRAVWVLAAALALGPLGACHTVTDPLYYGAMSTFGIEKRHILADRVEEGREAQEAAREEFRDALEAFQALTGFEGGELEEVYERLRDAYEESETRAETVRERIDAIERVAEDLFDEWREEIELMQDASLRVRSAAQLRETEARYARLIAAMRKAESRMEPVLVAFRDRVLYLKHNLNARAIASLEGDLGEIEADVERLVREMNASIAEAEAFLDTLEE